MQHEQNTDSFQRNSVSHFQHISEQKAGGGGQQRAIGKGRKVEGAAE